MTVSLSREQAVGRTVADCRAEAELPFFIKADPESLSDHQRGRLERWRRRVGGWTHRDPERELSLLEAAETCFAHEQDDRETWLVMVLASALWLRLTIDQRRVFAAIFALVCAFGPHALASHTTIALVCERKFGWEPSRSRVGKVRATLAKRGLIVIPDPGAPHSEGERSHPSCYALGLSKITPEPARDPGGTGVVSTESLSANEALEAQTGTPVPANWLLTKDDLEAVELLWDGLRRAHRSEEGMRRWWGRRSSARTLLHDREHHFPVTTARLAPIEPPEPTGDYVEHADGVRRLRHRAPAPVQLTPGPLVGWRQVGCPSCGARPMDNCGTRTGNSAWGPHAIRAALVGLRLADLPKPERPYREPRPVYPRRTGTPEPLPPAGPPGWREAVLASVDLDVDGFDDLMTFAGREPIP